MNPGTGRTGTAAWIALRRAAIHRAHLNGQTSCARCDQPLAWSGPKTDASPEVDHRTPFAVTGTAVPTLDEVRVVCRRCNRHLGGKLGNARMRGRAADRTPITTSRSW
jgi:hypothetical protein